MFRPLVITAAVLVLLAGCSKQEAQAPAAAAPAPSAAPAVEAPAAAPAPATAVAGAGQAASPAPAAAPAAPKPVAAPAAQGQSVDIFGGGAAAAAPGPSHNRGKVVQTQNGGGYTYAEVQMASGQKVWIAGSQIAVKPGSEVEWGNYSLMRDFASKSLGRTFQEILFVDRWGPVGQAAVAVAPHGSFPNGQPASAGGGADAMAAAAAGASPAAAGGSAAGTVKSVTQAGGYSYIEVDQGGGKTVWVAAMETPMKAGDKVQWQGGTQMSNFTARSLGRTFDKIIFAQSVVVGK